MGLFKTKQVKDFQKKSFRENEGNYYVIEGKNIFGVNANIQSDKALIDTYNHTPELSSVINYTANACARVPHKIVKIDKAEELKEIKKPEIEKLLAKPNQNQNGVEFTKQNIVSFLLFGNNYINLYSPETINRVIRMYCLPTQYITEVFENMENGMVNTNVDFRTNDVKNYQMSYGTSFKTNIEPKDIIHFKDTNILFDNGNYAKGFSRAHSSLMATRSLRMGYEAKVAFYNNRGAMGMLVNRSENGVHVAEDEKNRIIDTFKRKFGLKKDQSIIDFSNADLDYINIAPDFVALQIPENNELDFRTICKGMGGFPSVLLNDNRTATYNNVREAQIMLYTNLVTPIDLDYYENLTIGFKNRKMLNDGEMIIPDFSGIEVLQANAKDQESVKSLREKWSGQMYTRNALTIDEYRKVNGFDPDKKLTEQRNTELNNKFTKE